MSTMLRQQLAQVHQLWAILPTSGKRHLRRNAMFVPVLWMLELLALLQLSKVTLTTKLQGSTALAAVVVLLLLRSAASWWWTIRVSRAALRTESSLAERILVDYMDSDEERRRKFGTARTVRAFDSSVTEAISGALVGLVMLLHDFGLAASLLLGAVVVAPLTGCTILLVMAMAAVGYLTLVTSKASRLAHNLEETAVVSISRLYLMANNARDIHAMGRARNFVGDYLRSRLEVSSRRRKLEEIHTGARYYIEVVMFFAIIIFALAATVFGPSVSVPIALVLGMRVAPAVQRSLADWTKVRASSPAISTLLNAPAIRSNIPSQGEYGHCAGPEGTIEGGILRAERLSYAYPDSGSPVFSDVSLTVNRGETLVVTGDIGTGKSTLLDLLLGLRIPRSGSVLLLGHEAHTLSHERRRAVGLVPQQVPVMNASWRENLLFGMSDPLDDEDLWRCLDLVGLRSRVDSLDHLIGDAALQLSGGERQVLGLARVILANPDILFLDEPTSNLDKDSETAFLEVLTTLSSTVAIVLITHRPAPIALATKRLHLGGTVAA